MLGSLFLSIKWGWCRGKKCWDSQWWTERCFHIYFTCLLEIPLTSNLEINARLFLVVHGIEGKWWWWWWWCSMEILLLRIWRVRNSFSKHLPSIAEFYASHVCWISTASSHQLGWMMIWSRPARLCFPCCYFNEWITVLTFKKKKEIQSNWTCFWVCKIAESDMHLLY